MSPRTAFLSKLIGLSCILIAIALASHRQASVDSIAGLVQSPPLLLIFGLVGLVAGVALVLGHNVWSGGAASIIVTLIGWITVLRALLLLVLPTSTVAQLVGAIHFGDYFYLYMTLAFVLGVYLTYAGFSARPEKHATV